MDWMPLEGNIGAGPINETAGNGWIGVVSLVFITLAVIFYFRSKGALISAVSQLRDKKSLDKKLVYSESEPHTIKLMKVGFGLMAAMLLVGALLASPVVYLTANNYSSRAFSLGLMATIIYLPIFCILYYLAVLTPMFIVLQRMSIGGALKAGFDLIRKYWPMLIAFSAILLLVELVLVIVSLGLMVAATLPFVLLYNVFYDMGGQTAANILQGLAILAGFMVFFISMGLVAGFQRIAWTIAFFEIIKPVKIEEAATAETLPEVIT